MRIALAAILFFLLAASAPAASHVSFQVHLTASENDGEVFAQQVPSLTGKKVFVEKTAWISEHEVRAFYPYRSPDGASYGALLLLDDHGRTVLDSLSLEHRGTSLFIFVNGRVLTEMLIDKRVSDGTIYLASGLTEADVKSMAKDWKLLTRKKKK